MDPTTWIKSHKAAAGLGAAGVVGALALYERQKNAASSSGALPTTSTSTATPTVGYDSSQLDQYNQLAGAISDQNDAISQIQAELTQSATSQTAPASTSTTTPSAGASSPFNPYPVGTTVAPGEKIVQAVPVGSSGYIDVTSLGGLYTTPGVPGVSGSAYSPLAPKGDFSYSAQVNGGNVYEYTPSGVKTFKV